MSMYVALRVAHILAWVLTLALLLLAELLVWHAARASTLQQLHTRYRWTQRVQKLTTPLTILGLLAGIALVGLGGWQPFAPWLVVSYSLIVAMIVVGNVGQDPWQRRLDRMLYESKDAGSVAVLRTALRDLRALVARLLVLALLLSVIMVMNLKPSFGI
jgi:uncharacterized membrane protein SirB2